MVCQVGAEHLDADLRAHAGREHVDAVGDRLRPDVAPAGHLQRRCPSPGADRPSARPARRHRNTLAANGFSSSWRKAMNGCNACGIVRLVAIGAGRPARRSGVVVAVRRAVEQVAACGALADLFQSGPGERLDAAVEQLPVDLAARRIRPTARAAGRHGLEHFAGEGLALGRRPPRRRRSADLGK